MLHRAAAWCLAAALALAAGTGCGGHEDCDGHSHDPACLACQGDEDAFAAGTRVDGQGGLLAIEVVSATPSPHVAESTTNALRIRVLDASGQPVDNVTFSSIVPLMEGGHHGTPIVPMATATGTAGEYDITMINYIHEGRWTLTFELSAGGNTDTVQFLFCIDPASAA